MRNKITEVVKAIKDVEKIEKEAKKSADPFRVRELAGIDPNEEAKEEELEARRKRREAEMPVDRRCPSCRRFVFTRADWRARKGTKKDLVCKSCSEVSEVSRVSANSERADTLLVPMIKYTANGDAELVEFVGTKLLWSEHKKRKVRFGQLVSYHELSKIGIGGWVGQLVGYWINGQELFRRRRALGVGLGAFADLCKLDRKRIAFMEKGAPKIGIDEALLIQLALKELSPNSELELKGENIL